MHQQGIWSLVSSCAVFLCTRGALCQRQKRRLCAILLPEGSGLPSRNTWREGLVLNGTEHPGLAPQSVRGEGALPFVGPGREITQGAKGVNVSVEQGHECQSTRPGRQLPAHTDDAVQSQALSAVVSRHLLLDGWCFFSTESASNEQRPLYLD